jgi:hypothetical protein
MAVVAGHGGRVVVYASWNGATEVARWRVLGGARPGALHALAPAHAKTGFETAIHLQRPTKYLAVQALDSRGHLLRTSPGQAG